MNKCRAFVSTQIHNLITHKNKYAQRMNFNSGAVYIIENLACMNSDGERCCSVILQRMSNTMASYSNVLIKSLS